MGGIIGKLSFERDETLAQPVIEQMLDALRHRGSNNRGIHRAPGIALGWRGDVATNSARTIYAVADGDDGCAQLILDAYQEMGDRCVEHIHGPFACAVWDSPRQRLLLARDHAGLRSLYFAFLHGHGVVFASDIGALFKDPGVGRECCPRGIDAYLTYGYVPAPLTIYSRISTLEPAHRLVVEGRRVRVERYWSGASRRAGEPLPAGYVRDLERELTRAVAEQPAGAGLLYSGGPASAALLACLAATPDPARRVVTVGLEQDTGDLARSYTAARRLGADPIIEIATPDASRAAMELATLLEEPAADPSAVAQYSLFRAARPYLDEAIAGHGAAALLADQAPVRGPWPGEDRFTIYTRGFALDVRTAPPADLQGSFVPGDIPSRIERIADASGLRLRLPYMDRAVVKLAACAVSPDPLRALLAQHVDRALIPPCRPPQHPWLAGAVRAMVPGVLLGERFDGRGIVSRSALHVLWDEHRLGRRDHSHRLWSLLMLELWLRECIDGGVAEAPLEYAFSRAA